MSADLTPDGFYGGGNMTLSNNGDQINLYKPDATTLVDSSGVALDAPAGVSSNFDVNQISVGMADTTNDTEGAWCESASGFGSNGMSGTPGAANDACR